LFGACCVWWALCRQGKCSAGVNLIKPQQLNFDSTMPVFSSTIILPYSEHYFHPAIATIRKHNF
jgi:hypothetical protein